MKIISLTPTDTTEVTRDYQIEARLVVLECRYEAMKERFDRNPDTLTPSKLREFSEVSLEINRLKCERLRRLLDEQRHTTQNWTIYRNPQK